MRDYLSLSHLISYYLLNGALSGGLFLGKLCKWRIFLPQKSEKEKVLRLAAHTGK